MTVKSTTKTEVHLEKETFCGKVVANVKDDTLDFFCITKEGKGVGKYFLIVDGISPTLDTEASIRRLNEARDLAAAIVDVCDEAEDVLLGNDDVLLETSDDIVELHDSHGVPHLVRRPSRHNENDCDCVFFECPTCDNMVKDHEADCKNIKPWRPS